MIVKCPKCRFRFDVPASPGMRELQCNCPRCGVPFIHTIDEEEAATIESSDTRRSHLSGAVPPPIPEAQRTSAPRSTDVSAKDTSSQQPSQASAQQEKKSSGVTKPPIPPSSVFRFQSASAGTGSTPTTPKHRSKFSVFKPFIIGAVILLLLAGIISNGISRDDYDSNTDNPSAASSDTVIETFSPYDETMKEQKAPRWIQGKWYYKTEYGGITVEIRGNRLSETSGGETLTGTFRYQNHVLYGDFGKGGKFNYRVLEDSHQIDCGNGMAMQKIQ